MLRSDHALPEFGRLSLPLSVRLRNTMRGLGLVLDPGAWIDPAGFLLVCAYPRRQQALELLESRGIRRLLNLHTRRHAPARLARYSLAEYHVPVSDFAAPTLSQLSKALSVLQAAVNARERIAVHCGGGLGRSGTVAACYLIELGQDWQSAVTAVRAARPGAIETAAQLATIIDYGKQWNAMVQGAV